MEKILISACLLGTPCRYDGEGKPNKSIESLKTKYELIPVCPEVSGGLPTPRPPAELKNGRVINKDGFDVTEEYTCGALKTLALAKEHNITLAILKERSPSCGKGKIYDGSFSKTLIDGNGITAKLLIKNGIKVFGESEIDKIK